MTIYYSIIFFILGTIFGSFYNVVGLRKPQKKSIIYPGSSCGICNHKLKAFELIPVISYLMLRGKCYNCKTSFSSLYMWFEILTGILFTISFLVFGLSFELIISLIFISILVIITISDVHYMIILDEALIFGFISIFIVYLIFDINIIIPALISAFVSFMFTFILKYISSIAFKKESMGDGDIKLMFLIGFVLIEFPINILPLFLASFLALPFATFGFIKNQEKEFAFGPFIALGALILYFTKFSLENLLDLIMWF
ncbi:MAG: prepilin peptidase [Bacilli bacterium]